MNGYKKIKLHSKVTGKINFILYDLRYQKFKNFTVTISWYIFTTYIFKVTISFYVFTVRIYLFIIKVTILLAF